MNALLIPLSLLCGFVLCGTAVSLFALHRAYCLLGGMKPPDAAKHLLRDAELESLRDTVEALAVQLHDLQKHPPFASPPGLPKPGLNLNKRSQALRMHRHGEGAEQIAYALDLPRQEVDLLLKVHRIVISNV